MDEIMTAGDVVAAQCHMGAVQSDPGSSLPLSIPAHRMDFIPMECIFH